MVGQYKDDQLQKHSHLLTLGNYPHFSIQLYNQGGPSRYRTITSYTTTEGSELIAGSDTYYGQVGRFGTTDVTRGKRKGVKYIIKVL